MKSKALKPFWDTGGKIHEPGYRDEKTPIPLLFTIGYNIELKLTATPPNWRKLSEFLKVKPDWAVQELSQEINSLIRSLFPKPEPNYPEGSFEAGWYSDEKKLKPRGKHKRTQELVEKIGTDAKWLYLFIFYWKKQPPYIWPEPLKMLHKAYIEGGGKKRIWTTLSLTIYGLRKIYEQELKGNPDLKPFDNEKSFKTTYLDGLTTIKEHYFKNAPPEKVVAYLNSFITYTDILSNKKISEPAHPITCIFKALQEQQE